LSPRDLVDDTIRNFSSKYNKYHHHANDSGDDAAVESADNTDGADGTNADNASIDSWNDEPAVSSSRQGRERNSLLASRQDSYEEERHSDDEEASFA
jgi:hypothetical protein